MTMLAYGAPDDTHDNYLCMVESTTIDSMYRFCKTLLTVFGSQYMIGPNEAETTHIMTQNVAIGFLGMLGSM
jgi:hypothetical protein